MAEQAPLIQNGIPLTAEGIEVDSAAASAGELEKDIRRLAVGASISLASKLTGRALHGLGQILLARWLGPATFGLYAIGWTLLRVIGSVAPLGLDQGVIRFAPRYGSRDPARLKDLLFPALGIAIASGVVLAAVFYVSASWMAESVFGKRELVPVLQLFGLTFPLLTGLRVAAAATRITQRMKFSAYAEELTQPAVNLLLIVLFYELGWQLQGAVAAAVASFGAAFLLGLCYVRQLFPGTLMIPQQPIPFVSELMSFSLPASLAVIFTTLIMWVDRLMLAYFRPAADVGIYQAASQLAFLFAVILSGFNAMFAPMIVDFYQRGNITRLEELFRVATKWTFYLCLPAFLVICLAPHSLMRVIFGPEYAPGALPLLLLSVGQMVNAATGPVGLLLVMTGHQNRWFWASSLVLLADVITNVFFIPWWGITGAAIASTASITGLFLWGLLDVSRSLRLWPYDRRYLKGVFAGAVTSGVLYLISLNAAPVSLWQLLSLAFVSVVSFGGTLLLLGLEKEDRQFFSLFLAKIADSYQRR